MDSASRDVPVYVHCIHVRRDGQAELTRWLIRHWERLFAADSHPSR